MNDAFLHNRLFADVSTDTLRPVAIREMQFKTGEVIVREGAAGDTLLLVGTGRVQISKVGRQGQEEVLSILEPNDFFGEFAILDHGPRSATAIALEPSLIGEIDRTALDLLMESAPRILPINFTKVVVQRLRSTNARFIDELLRSERLTLLGTMLSSIVHDLKNPMTAIVSTASYLQQKAPDEFTKNAAEIIRAAADRMMLLTEELLDFARGTARLRPSWTTADRIVELLNREILEQIRLSSIDVKINVRTSEQFLIDEGRMTRCLANIIKNAREALKDRGEISLDFASREEGLLISVVDNGPGIPEVIRGSVFDPFVTAQK
ncbi:MAG TPA: cyclic nucleotide-binding domain-containing protein, partial [Chthoniobacterales bacterium]|nr:cyclic nucleotide-binding domain-containing protein [Chthoniobacterales bacterium]